MDTVRHRTASTSGSRVLAGFASRREVDWVWKSISEL